MSIIGLNALAKTATTSTQYVPVEDSNTSNTFKFLLQSLFPSMSTTGTGSQDLFISVTNSNQLNFKGLKSADTKMTVTTASNNLVLTLIESAIDLANCDNSTSAFLTAIDFAQTVSGENSVLNGGTGLSTITAGSILYASATDTLAASSAMSTNGQLLIGNATNGYPSVTTLTQGTNMTITNNCSGSRNRWYDRSSFNCSSGRCSSSRWCCNTSRWRIFRIWSRWKCCYCWGNFSIRNSRICFS